MANATDPTYLKSLLAQRERYRAERDRQTLEMRSLQAEIARVDAAARAIDDLLRIEAPDEVRPESEVPPTQSAAAPNGSSKPFVEAALRIVREADRPLYYRDLADVVRREGVPIPGKDPASYLYTALARDNRFHRPAPGHFALRDSQSPIPEAPARRRKRRARKRPSKEVKG